MSSYERFIQVLYQVYTWYLYYLLIVYIRCMLGIHVHIEPFTFQWCPILGICLVYTINIYSTCLFPGFQTTWQTSNCRIRLMCSLMGSARKSDHEFRNDAFYFKGCYRFTDWRLAVGPKDATVSSMPVSNNAVHDVLVSYGTIVWSGRCISISKHRGSSGEGR